MVPDAELLAPNNRYHQKLFPEYEPVSQKAEPFGEKLHDEITKRIQNWYFGDKEDDERGHAVGVAKDEDMVESTHKKITMGDPHSRYVTKDGAIASHKPLSI